MNEMYQQVVQFIQEQIATNELFKGGLILGIGAALLAWARQWPRTIWGWIVYHTTVELDIPEGNTAFKWVDRWLAEHRYSEKWARCLTAFVRKDSEGNTKLFVIPAPGRHFLLESGRLVILHRHREKLENGDHNTGKAYTETITMRVIGRDRTPAMKILEKARALSKSAKDNRVVVNFCDEYGSWFELTKKMPRPVNSVVLPDSTRDEIIEDAKRFQANQKFYQKLGVPWRRGYLFHGPPGNGKTTMIFCMAAAMNKELTYLNLREQTDSSLLRGLGDIPPNSILVIEDIDCLFDTEDTRETKTSVSFSGLINALDGVASPEGQMVVMTTNHKERLDPALIRPGRVDMDVEFKNATTAQAAELFRLFYPGNGDVEFSKAYGALPQQVSMAALQGHFLVHQDNPEGAVTNIGYLK